MKKAFCVKCQEVVESILVNKVKETGVMTTQCIICGIVTGSIRADRIDFNNDEWRQV